MPIDDDILELLRGEGYRITDDVREAVADFVGKLNDVLEEDDGE